LKAELAKYGLLLSMVLSACGPQVSELQLVIQEDGSFPCLGASHLRVRVNLPGHDPQKQDFDVFGLFFDATTFRCSLAEPLQFESLPTGRALGVSLELSDSSTQAEGIMAAASSQPFDISGSSPTQQINLALFRKPGISPGTVVVNKPRDWGAIGGIFSLQFRVVKDGEQMPVRAYWLNYDPRSRPDPFPLSISNLPAPQDTELYIFYLEGYDANNQLLRTWSGPIYLQKDSVAYFSP